MKAVFAIVVALLFCLSFANAQSNGCTICETVVAGVELLIANDPSITETEVEAYLNKACNISFLKPYEAECQIIISVYADKIVQELFSGTPGSQVCAAVHLCSSQPSMPKKFVPKAPVANPKLAPVQAPKRGALKN